MVTALSVRDRRRAEREQGARIQGLDAGTDDDERTDESGNQRGPAPQPHLLAEDEDRQHRGEQRGGEPERLHHGERRHRERHEEHHHGHDVARRAQHVQPEALRAQRTQALRREPGNEHEETEEVAKERDLEGMNLGGDPADAAVHDGEHHRRRRHQKRAAQDVSAFGAHSGAAVGRRPSRTMMATIADPTATKMAVVIQPSARCPV